MKKFPEEAWKHVIFTDESKINIFGPDGNRRVWRRATKCLKDHHVTQTLKFGGGSVMVWGGISYDGVGQLVFIDTKMTAELYIDILRSGYLTTLDMHGFDVTNSILQQDNDPKHVAKVTKSWLLEQDIKVLSWPACSPDMNIIENVWSYLKLRVNQHEVKPTKINDFKALVQEEWKKIPHSYIRSLYDSIPRRLDQLLKSKGSFTEY